MHTTLVRATAGAYDAKARGERHYLGPKVPDETLRQLGLSPAVGAAATVPQASSGPAPRTAARSLPPPVPTRRDPPAESPPPATVVEEALEASTQTSELSTSEFGAVDRGISSVTKLPAELQASATQAASDVGGGEGKLILVVDDEEEIRVLLKRLLLQKGYRVLEADRGLLALRLVKDHVPDLIILDAMLPELHGFDIARRIKGSAKYGKIPIIMVSAVYRGWRIAADLKQNYGVEEYIEKPFRIGRRHRRRPASPCWRRSARSRGGTQPGAPVG